MVVVCMYKSWRLVKVDAYVLPFQVVSLPINESQSSRMQVQAGEGERNDCICLYFGDGPYDICLLGYFPSLVEVSLRSGKRLLYIMRTNFG